MDNAFYHKDCGGVMSIEILKNFTWKSPSVSLTPDGIKIGVTEFKGTSSRKQGISFSCNECGEEIPLSSVGTELEVECTICQRKFPVENMNTCQQLQCVCDDCQKVITGKKSATTARQKEFVKYIFLGNQKEISFTPVSAILSKSVTF